MRGDMSQGGAMNPHPDPLPVSGEGVIGRMIDQ